MKKTLVLLNLLALVISVIWLIQSDFQYEPLIAIITLLVTLLSLFTSQKVSHFLNRSQIKGNKNKVTQKTKKSQNASRIEGNSNEVTQN